VKFGEFWRSLELFVNFRSLKFCGGIVGNPAAGFSSFSLWNMLIEELVLWKRFGWN
jgi:hypothetical protein